jgi:hypothetical protein
VSAGICVAATPAGAGAFSPAVKPGRCGDERSQLGGRNEVDGQGGALPAVVRDRDEVVGACWRDGERTRDRGAVLTGGEQQVGLPDAGVARGDRVQLRRTPGTGPAGLGRVAGGPGAGGEPASSGWVRTSRTSTAGRPPRASPYEGRPRAAGYRRCSGAGP